VNYSDAQDTLSRLAGDQMAAFADRWGRWPVGQVADDMVKTLREKAKRYEWMAKLNDLADEIEARAKGEGQW